ncbi:MAG: HAMP domain-containing sensor histidine kinase, partial [Niameybacter sp.]
FNNYLFSRERIHKINYRAFFVNESLAYTLYLICILLFSSLILATSISSLDAHKSALLCTLGCMNGGSFLFMSFCLLLLNQRYPIYLSAFTYTSFFHTFIIFTILFCIATLLVFIYFDQPHKRKSICYTYCIMVLIVFTLYQYIGYFLVSPIKINDKSALYYPLLSLILCSLTAIFAYRIAKKKQLFVEPKNLKVFYSLLALSMSIILGFLVSLYAKGLANYFYMVIQLTLILIFFRVISSDSIIQYSKDLTQKLELYTESSSLMNHYLQHMTIESQSIHKQYQYIDTLYSQMMFFYPNALFIIVDKNVYHANEHVRLLLKYDHLQPILYTPFAGYLAPEYRDEVETLIQDLYKHAKDYATIDIKMITATNEFVDVELYLTLSHADDPRAIIASAKDISYKIQEDKLRQDIELEKMKLEFFCTISHELKTPVNIIYSAAQLQNNFITQKEYDKIPTYNTMINQNCMRLLRLLNNFLDINRIESHFFNLTPRTLNIVDLTESLLGSTLSYMERKHITTLFDTEEEEIFCTIDADLLERALLNLLSNAIKYTKEEGHINIFISLEGHYACIHIQDNGVGIPIESQSLIFERFTRIENGLVRKAEGAGIGLSLVKSFVELNHGIIEVNSIVDQGTEFLIYLPVEVNTERLKYSDYVHTIHSEKIDIEFSDVYLT